MNEYWGGKGVPLSEMRYVQELEKKGSATQERQKARIESGELTVDDKGYVRTVLGAKEYKIQNKGLALGGGVKKK